MWITYKKGSGIPEPYKLYWIPAFAGKEFKRIKIKKAEPKKVLPFKY